MPQAARAAEEGRLEQRVRHVAALEESMRERQAGLERREQEVEARAARLEADASGADAPAEPEETPTRVAFPRPEPWRLLTDPGR